jgi:hypothetical protein
MIKEYTIIVSYSISSPHKSWDWCAVTDDYDGQETDPIGYGATALEAVEILLEQLENRRG